jgi:hypothetical protein
VSSTHIIRRQFLEVELIGTEADGLAVHRKLADLSRDWLTPALEAVLERWVPADEHWFIDRLDIDAGAFQLEDFERGFVAAVTGAIEQYFRERRPAVSRAATASARRGSGSSGAIERGSASHVVQEAFLYFLYTGVLPWWFRLPPGTTLEDCITADGRARTPARRADR